MEWKSRLFHSAGHLRGEAGFCPEGEEEDGLGGRVPQPSL